MMNPLNDKDFLKRLDLVKQKKTYVKVYNLTFDEEIRESIEGQVVSGSINIDGASAVRRTCSLSMVAENVNINNYLWSLNTKIRVFIGVENNIDSRYEEIIWFKQGTFVLTSFNISYTTNNYTINLTAQDKMCLLNGTIGGQLPASIDFKQQVINTKTYEKVDLGPIYIPDLYQTVEDAYMVIDDESQITEDRRYFKKVFQDFEELDGITELNFNKDECYKYNPETFLNAKKYFNVIFLTPNELQECLDSNITLYIKDSGESEEDIDEEVIEESEEEDSNEESTVIYKPIDLSNSNQFEEFDNTIDYYISQEYRQLTIKDEFNEFERYYLKDDKGRLTEILLDEETFDSYNYKNLYIQNIYIPALDHFETGVQYYGLVDGGYEEVALNAFSYTSNKFFYKNIVSFQAASEQFDENEEYYDLNGNYIDFYSIAYQDYESNKFYVPNIYEDDFIKYEGPYNPTIQYYQQNTYTNKEDVPIKTIIKEAVHTYGREPYYNIIINDVDDEGLLLKEYIGDTSLYLLVHNGICENITDENQECYIIDGAMELEAINLYTSLIDEELEILNKKFQQQLITEEVYKADKQKAFAVLIKNLNAQKTTINDSDNLVYNSFIEEFNKNPSKVFILTENTKSIKIYTVLKLEKGAAAGYELTDLTYPYDLVSTPGEALTSILDKIKDTLQNFEYFYDVDGHFVFQRKKTYLNTSWNNIITSNNETFASSAVDTSAVQYTFEDNDLIVSIGNNIKLDNLKNDYSVWGTRKTINDVEIPIHARFAIDQKPYAYVTFPRSKRNQVSDEKEEILKVQIIHGLTYLYQDIYVNNEYIEDILGIDEEDLEEFTYNKVRIEPALYKGEMFAGYFYNYIFCDWREIIYQMALDYYKHNQENDFLANLAKYNTFSMDDEYEIENDFMVLIDKNGGKLYPTGVTGYEQYYEDMQGFWRELYNPEPEVDLGHTGGYYLNKEWQALTTDFSHFNCDYYLPESDYEKYSNLLENAIVELEGKIKALEQELEKYQNNKDLNDLLDSIEEKNSELEQLKETKSLILKSYYTQRLFAFNDPEYKKLQQQYTQIENERDNLIGDIEQQMLSILRNEFELY